MIQKKQKKIQIRFKMINYKKALLKLKKNKINIYPENISAENSMNRISAVNLN